MLNNNNSNNPNNPNNLKKGYWKNKKFNAEQQNRG